MTAAELIADEWGTQRFWDRVRQEAFTAIRVNFTIEQLERLSREGNYTPVSGDAIAVRMR